MASTSIEMPCSRSVSGHKEMRLGWRGAAGMVPYQHQAGHIYIHTHTHIHTHRLGHVCQPQHKSRNSCPSLLPVFALDRSALVCSDSNGFIVTAFIPPHTLRIARFWLRTTNSIDQRTKYDQACRMPRRAPFTTSSAWHATSRSAFV